MHPAKLALVPPHHCAQHQVKVQHNEISVHFCVVKNDTTANGIQELK